MTTSTWVCTGRPPHEPPCGATGTTQASATRHIDDTRHATTSTLRPEFAAKLTDPDVGLEVAG